MIKVFLALPHHIPQCWQLREIHASHKKTVTLSKEAISPKSDKDQIILIKVMWKEM